MTFKEFQQSARLLCNILPHNAIEMQKITEQKPHIDEHDYLLVYDKDCYIFLEMQYGKIHEEDFFSYYLVIGNEEYFSDDLQKLEKILYNEHYKTA
tara:strand:+ start:386 stop:673 length:288 start_codon:yes stop_codon:yes gene_type:complete